MSQAKPEKKKERKQLTQTPAMRVMGQRLWFCLVGPKVLPRRQNSRSYGRTFLALVAWTLPVAVEFLVAFSRPSWRRKMVARNRWYAKGSFDLVSLLPVLWYTNFLIVSHHAFNLLVCGSQGGAKGLHERDVWLFWEADRFS